MKTLTDLSMKFFDGLVLNTNQTAEESESDKACFKKSLMRFLASGSKEDAFVIYFCFSEIFRLFGKGYDNTQKLLEMLSDHEYHSGELLSKHRDHYSHSVYVFALGLAVYANDPAFKNAFLKFYGLKDDGKAAFEFLYLWGLTSLFHDIGYPFQLAHEQIKNYSEELWGKNNPENPYVSFGNFAAFTAVDEKTSTRLKKELNKEKEFSSLNELFAYGLNLRKGYNEHDVCNKLRERIKTQPAFMDHAYFSAVILARQLLNQSDFAFGEELTDVLTAILLHNSFNKYDAPGRSPVKLTEHPLSYLLILCDELQNWDRLAYGKASKRDPIAWEITLSISENKISAIYYFESRTVTGADGNERLNKSYAETESGEFIAKIKSYITTSLDLTAEARIKEKNKKAVFNASDNNFINLCDFAKAIHASYLDYCKEANAQSLNESFDKLPLEFKVSNIEQAKSYAAKLELINCFYSGKDLDYPVIDDFSAPTPHSNVVSDNLGFLCREEHVRWVKEKLDMGWKYGTDYTSTAERNAKKIHRDLIPYEMLDENERKKDEIMINNIIPLLKKFGNNIRIYSCLTVRKPDLEIAGVGHRFIKEHPEKLKEQIKEILLKYAEDYRVIVRTCYGYGADWLIAECANELGLTTKASLPTDYESYIDVVRSDCLENGVDFTYGHELKMRHLLAQTVVCKTARDPEFFYLAASKYLIKKCKKLIALWDGKDLPVFDENGNPINRGGTYDCIRMARERGLTKEDIHIIPCTR